MPKRSMKQEELVDEAPLTDAERSKEDILSIATEEFAINGLSGARVDQIAERTRTSTSVSSTFWWM